MSKMIPLHIADQAVAACEAEIQKLREEVERLKASVRHQKAMLWALEAYTGHLAVDIDPNPWGIRNPHRKKNGCYFDGKPIPNEPHE